MTADQCVKIELYFHEDGRDCEDCPYYHSWKEAHGEHLAECTLVDNLQNSHMEGSCALSIFNDDGSDKED